MVHIITTVFIDATYSNHCAIECYMTSFMEQSSGRLKLIVYFDVPCCDVTSNVAQPDQKLLPEAIQLLFFFFFFLHFQTVFMYDAF